MAEGMNKMVDENVHQEPVPCAKGCGFYGNPMSLSMCSKCYRDHVLEQGKKAAEKISSHETKATESVVRVDPAGSSSAPASAVSSVVESLPASEQESAKVQKNTNRCFSCNKKVGLTGFKCRCSYTYCSVHRYSDKHDCSFDYKTAGRDAIAKANPTVIASKVDKI